LRSTSVDSRELAKKWQRPIGRCEHGLMDVKTTWPKLIFAGVIACVPAVLSYCKASQEADHARIEADAGYRTLVQNVRHLEMVVTAQNNALSILIDKTPGVGRIAAGSAAGSAASGSGAGSAAPAPPEFPTLPDSTAAALRMQSKD
jgi:hypothetical protein